MRQRTQPPERRRAGLLDAAQHVVVAKGIAALTVDEVTARAEVAKGTFYLYFGSKDELIKALQERFVLDMVERQAAELDELGENDWLGRLLHWMESSIRGYLARAELHDALFHHAHAGAASGSMPTDDDARRRPRRAGDVADTALNPHAAALQEILEKGTAAGTFELASPAAAAVILYTTMHGTADYLVGHADAAPSGTVDRVIAECLLMCRRYARRA